MTDFGREADIMIPAFVQLLTDAIRCGRVAMLLPGVPARARGLRPGVKRLQSDSLGAKLRRRRIELGLFAKHAAEQIGACEEALYKWEKDTCEPQAHLYPKAIVFLGYEPWVEPKSLGHRLRAERLRRGLSIKRAAALLEVDEGTFSGWERGTRKPTVTSRAICAQFLRQAA